MRKPSFRRIQLAASAGRFGLLRTEDFNELLPPMYASVGVGYKF